MQEESVIITPPDLTKPLELDQYFSTQAPLELDIGCGKGKFLVARAQNNPGTNFFGTDRLLSRLQIIEKKVRKYDMHNVKLLNIENSHAIKYLFPQDSVTTAYVFFPDPWPKRRHHRRRLFSAAFINSLHNIIRLGGKIHIATDHLEYYAYIYKLIKNSTQFEETDLFVPEENERTNFETLFMSQNKPIGRCSFLNK